MFSKLASFVTLSLIVAGCSTATDAPDSSSAATDTTESAFSTCGQPNEACCRIFEPGESGFSETFCHTGLTCTKVGAFEKCVTNGTAPVAGPPDGACGFKGHLCCPSSAVGQDGDHAPHCSANLACSSVAGVPTCVDPVAPSPVPAPTLCGGKGQRCCPSGNIGEDGSHGATCNSHLACKAVVGGIPRCH